MQKLIAYLHLAFVTTGPVAIWLSWRWTATDAGVAQFDGFMETSRVLAAYGAASWILAGSITLLRLTSDRTARLARALHANGFLLLYLAIIGTPAAFLVPVLAILISDGCALLHPRPGDGLSFDAKPIAQIGQFLAVIGAGLPLLAAPMGWTEFDFVLNSWLILLWLAAAFKLHRLIPVAPRSK